MARHRRSSKLETKAARARLDVRRKPYFMAIEPKVTLGYRRNKGAGTWVARGKNANGVWTKAFALADDHEDANGDSVLTFWQAQDKVKEIIRGTTGGARPMTVAEALAHYAADLKARGGGAMNVQRVTSRLPASLAAKSVALLGARDLRQWRDGLVANGVKPASADRTARVMKAALNLAAKDDARITNVAAWRNLEKLPDTEVPRNRIIDDETIEKIVTAAHAYDADFGLLVETAAQTGAAESQLLRLTVADLATDQAEPKLMMPPRKKGRRRIVTPTHRPVPISAALAKKLKKRAAGRAPNAPLLMKPKGDPRIAWDVGRYFGKATAGLSLDETMYGLRHASIVRQLKANVPQTIVAHNHDTSPAMLQRTYARYITTQSDALTRKALIDFE